MNKQDKRYLAAFALIILGFAFWFGAIAKLEFDGYISTEEFIARVIIGIVLIVVAVIISGDLPDIMQELSDKIKNRR